ncbi:MAG TPA: dGTPase, partial [Aliidiomarina sp.]|nr:dGTPase [Aliidiomarina sp.]
KALYQADADILDWVLEPLSNTDRELFQTVKKLPQSPFQHSLYKSFDASMMELADDIAYGVHDLEDAVVTGTLSKSDWHAFMDSRLTALPEKLRSLMQQLQELLFSSEHYNRKNAIGAMVNIFVTAVQVVECLPEAEEPLIRFNVELPQAEANLLNALKSIVFKHVINTPEIQQLRYRSQNMLLNLFSAFHAEPARLLPQNSRQRWEDALEQEGQQGADRALCDYIAGMTDDYANHMYKRMFGVG